MSAMSDYLEPKLLDELFNKVDFVGPATYVALFTAAPSDSGGGTEVTGGSYARILVNENAGGTPKWNLAVVDGVAFLVDNLNDIVFATATANWGTITHFAVFDAVTGGNLLVHGILTVSKVVNTDDTFKFLIGDLDIKFE